MSSWKDTVMNDTLIEVWVLEFIQPGELDLNAKLKEFAIAQAETTGPIAKQAGIMEVVEYTEDKFGGAYEGLTEHLRHQYGLASLHRIKGGK